MIMRGIDVTARCQHLGEGACHACVDDALCAVESEEAKVLRKALVEIENRSRHWRLSANWTLNRLARAALAARAEQTPHVIGRIGRRT